MAIVKATKEAERQALTEIERKLTEARKEADRLHKQAETALKNAELNSEKILAESELRKAQTEQQVEHLKNEAEFKVKTQLDEVRKEIDQRRNSSLREAEKIVADANATANDKLERTRAKIASELARERAKIEQIRREATAVAKSLETGYLSIRDQIDTARTTLGQYSSGLEDLTSLLSDTENLKED